MKISKDKSRDQKSSKVKRERNDNRSSGIREGWVGNRGSHRHVQGGTHKETPLPAILIVDGTA